METVIRKASGFLADADFDWAVCGGAAIDFLLRKHTRGHEDLDLNVFLEERPKVIRYMLGHDWRVMEMLGGGVVRELFDVSDEPRTLSCFPPTNTGCLLTLMENGDYRFELGFHTQTDFDYVDFLFNKRDDGCFCYAKNHAIPDRSTRPFWRWTEFVFSLPRSCCCTSRSTIPSSALPGPMRRHEYKSTDTISRSCFHR